MWVYILNFALIVLYGAIFKNKKICIVLSAIQLFLVLALRDPLLGVDNAVYMSGYEYISDLRFTDMISRLHLIKTSELIYPYSFEGGYVLLNWIISAFGIGFHGFLILHAAFCIFAFSKFVYRYSENYCLSFLLFIALGFFTYQFGILRQTLALAILLLSVPFIQQRKPFGFFLLCFVAFTIHRVAIIMLPLYFLSCIKLTKKRYVFALFALLAFSLASPILISSISSLATKIFGKNIQLQDFSLNAMFLSMVAFAVLILLFHVFEKMAKDESGNNILIWFFLWTIAVEVIGLYSDLIARAIYIPYIAIVALVPNVLENYKNKNIVKWGKLAVAIFSFIMMIWFLKDDFINPYIFFFQ